MAGNVLEWVEDFYHPDYIGAPADGSAWTDGGTFHVMRGGSFNFVDSAQRTTYRMNYVPTYGSVVNLGFRCARNRL
jgi:formylglycine-generating enzyme required for sulfatase activity